MKINHILKYTLIVFVFNLGFSQNNKKESHYVLPDFVEGRILMKDGTELTRALNYNSLSENFAFKDDGKILAMSESDISRIDTIYVANRKFFRKDNVFLELLKTSSTPLYLEHKCNLESSTAASGGYGGTSQTTSGRTVTSIENRGNFYEIDLPEIYKIKPYKQYWIIKEGTTTIFKTLGQLKKLYQDKKKQIKIYRKTNKVDVKTPSSVVKLIEHLEA
ncbi:MAG: hypothetical protein HRU49_12775 [Winogradskyella sp.]|uniref:hypothetical protein n=1 Tax=Winogradskyella sp. TaxID=1883156 RepID=UPI0025E6F2F8|nr:hypothetical protein [Winogradskyella sp.]NRB84621.1 hypothetical protein [Winogradskyella sp.]